MKVVHLIQMGLCSYKQGNFPNGTPEQFSKMTSGAWQRCLCVGQSFGYLTHNLKSPIAITPTPSTAGGADYRTTSNPCHGFRITSIEYWRPNPCSTSLQRGTGRQEGSWSAAEGTGKGRIARR